MTKEIVIYMCKRGCSNPCVLSYVKEPTQYFHHPTNCPYGYMDSQFEQVEGNNLVKMLTDFYCANNP